VAAALVQRLKAPRPVLVLHTPVEVAEVRRLLRRKVTVVPVDRVLLLFGMLVPPEHIQQAVMLIIIAAQEHHIGYILLHLLLHLHC
jgi:hypothetical protein